MAEAKKTIFVVDDDVLVRGMLDRSLRKAGFDVHLISSGRDALNQLQASQPDLVLLDIDMPELNGLETLRLIRSNPATRRLPVILLTGVVPETDQIIHILDLDPSDFITKITSPKEIVARVNWVMRRCE
ncbi:MAG: response regulator [Ignavibacteriae bacterium]|nr:response regulator [Ignavibacteriota bacterium]